VEKEKRGRLVVGVFDTGPIHRASARGEARPDCAVNPKGSYTRPAPPSSSLHGAHTTSYSDCIPSVGIVASRGGAFTVRYTRGSTGARFQAAQTRTERPVFEYPNDQPPRFSFSTTTPSDYRTECVHGAGGGYLLHGGAMTWLLGSVRTL